MKLLSHSEPNATEMSDHHLDCGVLVATQEHQTVLKPSSLLKLIFKVDLNLAQAAYLDF